MQPRGGFVKHDDVYITGIASVLGQRDPVREAVARGDYDPDDAAEDDLESISVIPGAAPTELAARALGEALSFGEDRRIDTLIHTGIHFQGQDYWTPAAHIARTALPDAASSRLTTLEIRQASNGGLAALHTGALFAAANSGGAVAVTAADVFAQPHFDRYRSDKGLVLADGAAAVVLDRSSGIAAVRSSALIGDPSLEPLYAGDAPRPLPNDPSTRLDLRGRKDIYLADHPIEEAIAKLTGATEEVLRIALEDADCKIDQIDRFVFPNTGRGIAEWKFLSQYGIDEDRTLWKWGRTVGHIGAADQLAGLHHLISTGATPKGSLVALCSSGIGFNWGAAIIEIIA
jgi:3-oxoacyl-[acyl-carrier-protein] synthase-3